MDEIDSYIATIDELVEDENKIVTYKFLSHQLALPVNKAKYVLEQYLTNNESGKVSAVYALTGRSRGKIKCMIVTGNKLEAAKSKLESLISCHVYSVQKTNLKDTTPLYNADYDLTKTLLYKNGSFGMIRYDGAKQLSDEEINSLRSLTISKQPSPNKAKPVKSTNNHADKKAVEKSQQNSFFTPKPVTKPPKTDLNKENNAKRDLPQNDTTNSESNAKEASKITKTAPKRKGMELFMTTGKADLFESHRFSAKTPKPDEGNALEATSTDQKNGFEDISLNEAELTELAERMDADDLEKTEDNENKKETSVQDKQVQDKQEEAKPAEKPPKPKRSLSRKSKFTNKNGVSTKKRKRIQENFSSSSSESEDEFNDLDVIPSSPVAPLQPKVDIAPKNPRKKRILKSHTYIDKDGSMLTEKVWEEVSCSDSEEENQPAQEKKSPASAKPTFKKSTVFKGKQSTLMGFFSKKS